MRLIKLSSKLKRHNFNMVEIMLAVVVLAIGMTSVFVLFPVGLKSHSTARAENNIADLAEYLMTFIRADVQQELIDTNSFSSSKMEMNYCFKTDNGKLFSPHAKTDPNPVEDAIDNIDDLEADWEVLEHDDKSNINHAIVVRSKKNNGVYLIRQLVKFQNEKGDTISYADFSAFARVWLDKGKKDNRENKTGFDEDYFPGITSNNKNCNVKYSDLKSNLNGADINYFLLPVILEISYPADIPYNDREKRYFRFEIFNDQFEQRLK